MMLLNGRIDQLDLLGALQQGSQAAPGHADPPPAPSEEERARRVEQLVKKGAVSKAWNVLTSDSVIAPPTTATFEALVALHPPARTPAE